MWQGRSGSRVPSTLALRVRGLAVVAIGLLVTALTAAHLQGRFHDDVSLTIEADSLVDGLLAGADVKFQGAAIGTVRRVQTAGDTRRVEISIDRDQAPALTDRVAARFTVANVFGTPAIELVNLGDGPQVREHAVVPLATGAMGATATGVLQRTGRLTEVLDSPRLRNLLDVATENPGLFGPTVEAITGIARALEQDRRGSTTHYLHITGDLSDGLAVLEPQMVDALIALLDQSEYFGDETNRARTRKAIAGLSQDFLPGYARLVGDNRDHFAEILAVVLDLGLPLGMSYGSIAPAYQRLPDLLDRIGAAFPVVDGKVQWQLEIIADTMPHIARSVTDTGPGGVR
ncbi:MlaD family protein [Nocardia sp. NBC_00881]|uniref:MlaD family protein n=1 Tax=Nocardia sp. NBC_00881 TaxID=2975995 RepID=UPI003865E159|nr:MlaD family protein [Nocardia sp. NBC_00881]